MLTSLRRYSRYATTAALSAGVFFFVWLVYKVGTGPILQVFRQAGWRVAGVVLAYGLFQLSYCRAWSLTLRPKRIPFVRLFFSYLSGDAVNYVFPMAGEATKVALLRPEYPTIQGLFSVSVAKFCEFVAQLVFYLIGVTMTLFVFPLPNRVRATGLVFSTGLAVMLAILFRLQRKGLYAPVLRLVEKVIRGQFSEETRRKIGEVDRMIAAFYVEDPGRFAAVVLLKLIGKIGGAAEAALVLAVLGRRPTVPLAFAVETLSMIAQDMFFFIPGRVGGAEGGRTLVFLMLGFTAPEGLAYALIRRARELCWNGVGLAYLVARKARGEGGVKAVVFDFDGTLDGSGRSWRDRLFESFAREGLAGGRAAFDRAWERSGARLRAAPDAGRRGLRELVGAHVDGLFEELGLDGNGRRRSIAEAFVRESAQNLERSAQVLRRLKKRYRVGILDNFYGNLGQVCLESGLADAVDLVVDSSAVGCEKPDPEIFDYALSRLGLRPEEVLYVGDSAEQDMRGARAAGLRHVWLCPPGAGGESCCRGDQRAASLEDVERLVGEPA